MPRFNSIRIAIDLAETKRDQALAVLRQQRFNQAHAYSQMSQLEQYAEETQSRWTQKALAGTSPELLHHHYQFMSRLQQAVVLQQDTLTGLAAKVKEAQQQLMLAEVHMASLNQLMSKRQSEYAQSRQRQEQKQMDEFAAMQSRRQRLQQLENQDGH